MLNIRYADAGDKDLWFSLDKHLPEGGFERKAGDHQCYVILDDERPKGILRYNLFWDTIPFCTLLYIEEGSRNKGYGRRLMEHWENDMRRQGHGMVLTSTQVDEDAQNFYRKAGYKDCGGLILDIKGYEQPMELFLCKAL